ncbi:MAG: hypothetical protein RR177_00790 [Oscillospiraceae bacterium]
MNESEKNVNRCAICGAENEGDYLYCSNCGAVIKAAPVEESCQKNSEAQAAASQAASEKVTQETAQSETEDRPTEKETEQTPNNVQAAPIFPKQSNTVYCGGIPVPEEIDGVATEDIKAFVGANQEYYIPKFAANRGKTTFASWNWPTFLFGFFLNIPFVWFFYRRMNKIGAIVMAISVALMMLSMGSAFYSIQPIIDGSLGIIKEQAEKSGVNNYNDNFLAPNQDRLNPNDDFMTPLPSPNNGNEEQQVKDMMKGFAERLPFFALAMVFGILNFGLTIITSIMANGWYKKNTLSKIRALKKERPEISAWEISVNGSTSVGPAVALGVIVPIVMIVISFGWVFALLSKMVSEMMTIM